MSPSMARLGLFFSALVALLILSWPSAVAQPSDSTTEPGRRLFVTSCASCHGSEGLGSDNGPSLIDAGAASVDFYLRTGRMPLADPGAQAIRKPPAFDEAEIAALVDYVGSLGDGPEVPEVPPLGSLPEGQQLFIAQCAPCHGATANGGAVGPGALAPSLLGSNSLDVTEAVLIGPGEMPVFDFDTVELGAILRFIDHLQTTEPPGGADLGQIGPVPEGYVAWGVGMGFMILISVIIGRKRKDS